MATALSTTSISEDVIPIIITAIHSVEHTHVDVLAPFIKGKQSQNILETNLIKKPYFGICKHLEEKEIRSILTKLHIEGYIEYSAKKLVQITPKGLVCITNVSIDTKTIHETEITTEDEQAFETHAQFLGTLNIQQKKAVVSNAQKVACIAGAGSGKTTVLAKRIAFLIMQGVPASQILAITFTRKARIHMRDKISDSAVKIHTFNSFAETMLRAHNKKAYSKPTRIITFAEKIEAVQSALLAIGSSLSLIIPQYFSSGMLKTKTQRQLQSQFVADCFSIIDYFNNNNETISPFFEHMSHPEEKKIAQTMFTIVKYVKGYMKKYGLRDFSDQIIDCIQLFSEHKDTIPSFKHILVDEYQDINAIQKKLLDMLNAPNFFCVGDPRQAIYGWRGSKVEFIKNLNDAEHIYLTTNYRSGKSIVDVGNKIISAEQLPDLISGTNEIGEIYVKKYADAEHEAMAIMRAIKASNTPLSEIFVIGRTNKQIELIAQVFTNHNIPHVVKSDELHNLDEEVHTAVTILTAHCSKGLEAEEVFCIGAHSKAYPCIKNDHKVIEFIKEYYNRRDEECRLLYVACTRARKKLHISHYHKKSPFLNNIATEPFRAKKDTNELIVKAVRTWRNKIAQQLRIPSELIITEEEILLIAKHAPQNMEEIKTILKGTKANRYGRKILEVITSVI